MHFSPLKRFYHPFGQTNSRLHDSDEDDDSDEVTKFRGKRSSSIDPLDSKVTELAEFAVRSMDALSEDPKIRVVEKVMSATKKVSNDYLFIYLFINFKMQVLFYSV